MTIIDLDDRLSRLEQRRIPAEPDPRVLEEARSGSCTASSACLSAHEAGEEPTSPIGRALVEHDFDIVAACEALVERRRLGWQ